MEFSQIILFLIASLALIVAPGPDMVYVLARGISGGKKTGLYSAAGITIGILIHTVLASAGLAALFKASPVAFIIVKYAGAAYLLFLGIKAVISSKKISVEETARERDHMKSLKQGIITNVLNPKVALFILAFLPQFINGSAGSPALQMVLLGSTYAVMTLILYSIFGYFTGYIGTWLKNHPTTEKWIHRFSGLVLIGLGLRLAFLQQK